MRASFLVLTAGEGEEEEEELGKSCLMRASELKASTCSRLACSASLFFSRNPTWGGRREGGGRGEGGRREGGGRVRGGGGRVCVC